MRVHEVLLAIAVVASYPIIADRARAVDSDGRIYDIVFERVRAIDPETGLDAVRNIGIVGNKIGAISVQPLQGKKSIDARGLVASPGFIDLHSHAYGYETATYQAMDGVTTRLELELGVFPVKRWYDKKAGHELINYGASVNHDRVRYSLQVGGDLADARIPGGSSSGAELLAQARVEAEIVIGIGIAVGHAGRAIKVRAGKRRVLPDFLGRA